MSDTIITTIIHTTVITITESINQVCNETREDAGNFQEGRSGGIYKGISIAESIKQRCNEIW